MLAEARGGAQNRIDVVRKPQRARIGDDELIRQAKRFTNLLASGVGIEHRCVYTVGNQRDLVRWHAFADEIISISRRVDQQMRGARIKESLQPS